MIDHEEQQPERRAEEEEGDERDAVEGDRLAVRGAPDDDDEEVGEEVDRLVAGDEEGELARQEVEVVDDGREDPEPAEEEDEGDEEALLVEHEHVPEGLPEHVPRRAGVVVDRAEQLHADEDCDDAVRERRAPAEVLTVVAFEVELEEDEREDEVDEEPPHLGVDEGCGDECEVAAGHLRDEDGEEELHGRTDVGSGDVRRVRGAHHGLVRRVEHGNTGRNVVYKECGSRSASSSSRLSAL